MTSTRCSPTDSVASSSAAPRHRRVAEAGYLIDRQLGSGAESAFCRSIAHGDVVVEVLSTADYLRVADLVDQYADFPLGGTDASLMAIAERLKLTTVATLDGRHFHAVRPQHCDSFEIVS